ncbi:MAG: hypothetical protein AAF718_02350 [Pseudomonadota bacterium]
MSLPQLADGFKRMSIHGLLFWSVVVALGVTGLTHFHEPPEPVATLEQSLGDGVSVSGL